MNQAVAKSKKLSELPEQMKVKIWDLQTNRIEEIPLRRYQLFSKEKDKKGAFGTLSEFNRRYYRLEDFQGQKIEIYHWKAQCLVDVMTLELYQEIQRRNPPMNIPQYENGVKISDTYSKWEDFITTPQQAAQVTSKINAPKPKSIEEKIQEEVQKALAGAIPLPKEGADKTSETPKPGRRGRKSKEISNQ